MRLAFASALRASAAEREKACSSAAPYLTAELAAEPRRFSGSSTSRATRRRAGLRRRPVAGGDVITRELSTSYVPYVCGDSWPVCVENDRIVIEHWMHRPGVPHATILALHGFTMGTSWIDAHVLMAAKWFALGYDVALMALPFHGPRCPTTARYSGSTR